MSYERPKDTAKKIRAKLKKEFPDCPARHFSVRFDNYSTIYVTWQDYPSKEEVDEILRHYKDKSFDGMTDSVIESGYTDPDTGEHVQGYAYILSSFSLTPERTSLLTAQLKQVYLGFDSYSPEEQLSLLYRNTGKYRPDGKLKEEYREKPITPELSESIIDEVVDAYYSHVNLEIPEIYLKDYVPEVKIVNNLFDFGENALVVKLQIKNILKQEYSPKHFRNEGDYRSALTSKVTSLNANSLPFLKEMRDTLIKEIENTMYGFLDEYMKEKNLTNTQEVINVLNKYYRDDFPRDFYYETLNDAKAFQNWNSLMGHFKLDIYKNLNQNLDALTAKEELNTVSVQEPVNETDNNSRYTKEDIEKWKASFEEIKSKLKYTTILYTDSTERVLIIGLHYTKVDKDKGNVGILSIEKENGKVKVLVNSSYSEFGEILDSLEKYYLSKLVNNDASEFQYSLDSIEHFVFRKYRERILDKLINDSDNFSDSDYKEVYNSLFKKWMIESGLDLKEALESKDSTIALTPEFKQLCKDEVEIATFEKKALSSFFNKEKEETEESIQEKEVVVKKEKPKIQVPVVNNYQTLTKKILEKELESMKGNKELLNRTKRILMKQITFDGTMLDYFAKSRYGKSYNGLVYMDIIFENVKIIVFPHACYKIIRNEATNKYMVDVVYSLRQNTLVECENAFVKKFQQYVKNPYAGEFLNESFTIVKNMSLRK